MKKQYLTILPLLFLLLSCSGNQGDSTSQTPSDTTQSSDSESSLVSSVVELTKEEKEDQDLAKFNRLAKAKEGKVYRKNSSSIITNYYLTDGAPMTIKAKKVSQTSRYGSGEQGPIQETTGTMAFFDEETNLYKDSSSFTTQVYHDEDYFYKINAYPGEANDVQSVAYDPAFEETNLNISYTNEVAQDIEAMRNMVGDDTYLLDYEGITENVENGIWYFRYQFTHYDIDLFTILETVCFENEVTIKDNLITKVQISFEDAYYAGNIKANWITAESTSYYEQGDYPEFTGTYLSHN